VEFTYRNGEEADQYTILESLGGGVALLDYDGDGLLDLFIPGGGTFNGPEHKTIQGYPGRLYRNLGGWKFQDVTAQVGLNQPVFYTHGCAVADYDRDGWPDLLVTGYGRLALYHNEPDGKGGRRFREVSKAAGLPEGLWTTGAAWGDLDGDGFPDLYLCQYLGWSFANHPRCPAFDPKYPAEVCPPRVFAGLPHKLYRNNGNGTFTDVSQQAGLRPYTGDPAKDQEPGKGLGVVIGDVDGDGKPDIYVANDTVDNFLYLNRSTGKKLRLEEVGLERGVARDDKGMPDGSMGVDLGDFDRSGRPAIWVTNFENEMHALYRNLGNGQFLFCTPASGIAAIGQLYVGFGTAFVDLDNRGWEDLVVVNGHVLRHPPRGTPRQLAVILHNQGGGRFVEITRQGGDYFQHAHMGRGLVVGDLDNDGRPDLVICHSNEPVVLLRNQAETGHHWLGVSLVGRQHRDIAGARVVLETDGARLTRFAKGGGSYLSSSDRRLLFGLGESGQVRRLTVSWPWGDTQTWDGSRLAVDRYWRLVEGQAEPEATAP
jgi:hypothetical protein